jgi:hypothetical protein
MKRFSKILFILLLFVSFITLSQAQEAEQVKDINNQEGKVTAGAAFEKIESSIAAGNVEMLSGYFSSQMYLSLSNGISGYYSSNQAYYVLEDFFKNYRVVDFKFNNVKNGEEDNVYATGLYNYILNEKRESAQAYVSIKLAGEKWKITQLTIN